MSAKMLLQRIACCFLLVGLAAGCGAPVAGTPAPQILYIENAWARPSPLPNGSSAVYLTVVNPTESADRLLNVSSQLGMAGLHESITKDNVVSMEARPEGFEVPPRGSVELAPAAKHIMIMGVAAPLAVGDKVTVTLNFETYGPMTITVPVKDKAGP